MSAAVGEGGSEDRTSHAGVEWMEHHQVALYIAALAFGAVVGLVWPQVAAPAGLMITPVLALLLYATFLGVPLDRVGRAFKDWRFLSTVLAVNFVTVPLVVWPLSRIVAHDRALLLGVLLVLLTPCIDYVIVFSGQAGGDRERLLAATPLLMLTQMLLLPLYLWLFVGPDIVGSVDFAPFVEAFGLIIVLPLVMAWFTQLAAARTLVGRRVGQFFMSGMVPLMVATLAVVVASQVAGVGERLGSLLLTVPVYVLFATVMVVVGMLASRLADLDTAGRRAVVLSGVTRNSLVVLPLALALPAAFDLAPLAVVTQTLVELLAMVILIRVVPRLLSDAPDRGHPLP